MRAVHSESPTKTNLQDQILVDAMICPNKQEYQCPRIFPSISDNSRFFLGANDEDIKELAQIWHSFMMRR